MKLLSLCELMLVVFALGHYRCGQRENTIMSVLF